MHTKLYPNKGRLGEFVRTSIRRLQCLIENSPEAITLMNLSGEIEYGSRAITTLLGYLPEEVLGQNWRDLMHPDDRGDFGRAWQDVVTNPPGRIQWSTRVRRKDGEYAKVAVTLSNLLFDFQVQGIAMYQRDLDGPKTENGKHHQRTQDMSVPTLGLKEFAYTAAHDLQAPLRAISVYTGMLTENAQLDDKGKQMAQFIAEGAQRMSALVTDLLSFATTGENAPTGDVDLQEVLMRVTRNLAPLIESNEARVTASPLPVVRSNEVLLERLFQNLITNALAYRSLKPVEIDVSAAPSGSDWTVRIKDNGVGVRPENHDRVFLPFKRFASSAVPGSGLGLAICKKIVENLGGKIWMESEIGCGATFCFTIAGARGLASHGVALR